MKWTDIRRKIAKAFISTLRDNYIISRIRNLIMKIVPVRSGFLLNHIMKTMQIDRWKSRENTRFKLTFSYEHPANRPLVISNPQHSPPDMGYGDWSNVKLQFPIPNVTLIRTTPFGNALYLLNDPSALADPKDAIANEAEQELMRDLEETFENIVVSIAIGGNA